MNPADPVIALFPEFGRGLLEGSGRQVVEKIGIEAVREVVYAVLCGENLRNETELLTRRRLGLANGALLMLYLKGCRNVENFLDRLPVLAAAAIQNSRLSKQDRWIINWMLGLTDKSVQNILRDDPEHFAAYLQDYQRAVTEAAKKLEEEFGPLDGTVAVADLDVALDWKLMVWLFGSIGAQTLTIRGSEKSIYGKLFERLILGSLLHILGFRKVDSAAPVDSFEKVFWLSERKDKRESDATVLYKPGQGIRFDIGFIGRGNSEISLDKVSRFEREMEYGRREHVMATFIIVDRVGAKSRIAELARAIEGTIVQMSMSYWPKLIALELGTVLGMTHELQTMPEHDIAAYLRARVATVPIEDYLPVYDRDDAPGID